nr:hypothetical protein 1.16 [Burkholderia phage Bups phi1]
MTFSFRGQWTATSNASACRTKRSRITSAIRTAARSTDWKRSSVDATGSTRRRPQNLVSDPAT